MKRTVAVVTGAGGALGGVLVSRLVSAGVAVARIDLGALLDEPGVAVSHDGVDLSDEAAASATLDAIARDLGGIDLVFNVAGAFRWQTTEGGDVATWDLLHRVNLRTTLNTSRGALRWLRESGAGRIVNVGSIAGHGAGAGMGAYAASKAAVHRLTEGLAAELKAHGITVNAVVPSTIDTPANRRDMPGETFAKWVTLDEVVEVMLFLASDRASGVTGALVPVAGRV